MVIAAFPAAKLSVLLIKQISKPIANLCKERAKNHPFFRKYVCMPPAQFYNWCEVKAKMWILNLGKPVNIPVLSQDMAIELGANLLGEAVIFTIGASLLTFEYTRQSKKEAAKEEKRLRELEDITDKVQELYFTIQQQQAQLKEMERIVLNLTSTKPNTNPPKDPTSTPPPPSTPQKPSVTPSPSMKMDKNLNDLYNYSTPYPDIGLVFRALNYIQMDILNMNERKNSKSQDNQNYAIRWRESMISKALDNIEIEHRSLF